MGKMKILIIAVGLFLPHILMAQSDTLTIQYCYEAAEKLSPLKKQELLNQEIYELSYENIGTGYLPKLVVNGKLTYQSDVFAIPGTTIIGDFPVIPKEQYQLSLNLQQNIYDGGVTKFSKILEESRLQLNQLSLETQLYQINEKINVLYFSYLQLQESEKILRTALNNLSNQRKIIEASVNYGLVLESNLYNIDKQILTTEQELISLESDQNAIAQMLAIWIGRPIGESVLFTIPDISDIENKMAIARPELKLFDSQKKILESQKGINNVEKLPQFWAYALGGIGRPNPLNFFEIEPATFYLIGLQMNWQIFDWGKVNRSKQIFQTQQAIITTQEEEFRRNIDMALTKQFIDIEKLKKIIAKDIGIIELQDKVVRKSFSEMNNGVITATEYLTELNALTQAKIKKVLHELELSKTYISIYTTTGNEL